MRTYQPKKLKEAESLYPSTCDECVVAIRKTYLQHWLVKDLKPEFKVRATNKWHPHPINIAHIAAVKDNYKILAESAKGPHVAQHKHCVVVQFEISAKYPASVQILRNFIEKKTLEIQATATADWNRSEGRSGCRSIKPRSWSGLQTAV